MSERLAAPFYSDFSSSREVDDEFYRSALRRASEYAECIVKIASEQRYLNELAVWLNDDQAKSSEVFTQVEGLDQDKLANKSLIEKLHIKRLLRRCIDRSMFYILLRDIGLDPSKDETHQVHKTICRSMHKQLVQQIENGDKSKRDLFDFSHYFPTPLWNDAAVRQELTWLRIKIARIKQVMPPEFDTDEGIRKLVKIIGGVLLHTYIDSIKHKRRLQQPDIINGLRLGYSYGITYPLIDDLLDNPKVLSREEKRILESNIRKALRQQAVPAMPKFSKSSEVLLRFVYGELAWSLKTIKNIHSQHSGVFFKQAELFYLSQEADSKLKLKNDAGITQRLALMILKSSGSRIVVDQLTQARDSINDRFFYFGIFNQFNDDIKDIAIDLQAGHSTPYTESYKQTTSTAFRFHIAVVYYLIKHTYQDDRLVRELLITRMINAIRSAHKIFSEHFDDDVFASLIKTGHSSFDNALLSHFSNDDGPIWLDKVISKELVASIRLQQKRKQSFKAKFDGYRQYIDSHLAIQQHRRVKDGSLHCVANHTLLSGGKRVRSVLAMHLLKTHGNLSETSMQAVLQLLEYMHTASLIIDDLPSQDNSPLRRGQLTAHIKFNSVAKAELAAISLMMKAVEVQAKIKGIAADRVLRSIHYAANTTQAICEGQYMDLSMSGQQCIAQLEEMSWLKTGLALEASLVIPAMLLGIDDIEISRIKDFSRKLGLVFQIKDDLIDYEGDTNSSGKPVAQDRNKVSYVSLLGHEQATERLAYELNHAMESLNQLSIADKFLADAVQFIAYR